MATRNSSRRTRRNGRSGGNRPRTRPSAAAPREDGLPQPIRSADGPGQSAPGHKRRRRRPRPDPLASGSSKRGTGSAEQFHASPPQGMLEIGGVETITALERLHGKLRLIRSTVAVTVRALRDQNCELDDDIASVLGHHVIDALTDQMAQIGLLLQKPGYEFGGES